MLRVSEGEVEIRGKKIDLMAEYTHLTHRLIECDAFTVSDIDECVRIAKKSEKEVEEQAKQLAFDFVNKLLADL